jgi:UDPglucose 6-dehydrogenase
LNIAVIGAGYVGLVSGACLADFGHSVTCIDLDSKKIASLKSGEMPIYEPGLEELVARNASLGRLLFTTEMATSVRNAEVVFIAVGTPASRDDSHADLTYVHAAVRELSKNLDPMRRTVIVDKSTVPVGTGDEIERMIASVRPDVKVSVVANPEFLREGAAIKDFKRPDRIVVGTDSDESREVMRKIYQPLLNSGTPILFTSRRSAELIKYASNAFLAMKITFINEMADLCERLDADVEDVAQGIGLDSRVGSKFLEAGPGYGGSCFPKDTLALIQMALDNDMHVRLVETTVKLNDQRKRAMTLKVAEAVGGTLEGKIVAVLGLTFKPNTDDIRDSPAIAVVQGLQAAGATVRAFDPEGMDEAAKVLTNVSYGRDSYDTMEGADICVIVTEWDVFRNLELARMSALLKTPILVDLRNIYRRADMVAAGFHYVDIGRGKQKGTGIL